jgi:uncharacterized protein (DUF2236 family)
MSGELPISWTIHSEIVLLLGWGRAILMQLAHPLVAAGVAEHSAFRAEMLGGVRRLRRTLRAMLALTFGSPDEIRRAADGINAIHDRIAGRLARAEGVFPAGTPYAATDPALLAWVHATLVDSFLSTYALYVRPLAAGERDAYCAESAGIDTLLRIPADRLARSEAELRSYLAAMLGSGEVRVTDTARALAREILWPPGALLAWPALATLRLSTAGLLPPALREAYGLGWDARRAATLRATAGVIRRVLPALPSALRHWPSARAAMDRARAGG